MTGTPHPDARHRVAPAEVAVALLVLLGGVAVAWYAGAVLWTRPFWMDELCCTVFPVADSRSFLDLFANVRHDDVAPPLLHAILWVGSRVVGSLSPAAVRSVMVLAVVLALLMLYVLLRRRFTRMAAAGAVLAVAGHVLVLHHAFEARFYGWWLFFAVLYAWNLGGGHRPVVRAVVQGAVAVCLVSIHWFGVTSLGVMAVAAVATFGSRWRAGLRFVAPSLAGLVVLALLTPMMRAQLGQGGEDLLWVLPLSLNQVAGMIWLFFLRIPPVLAVIVLAVNRLRGRARRAIAPLLREPDLAALLSLALMPFVLVVISAVLEPVMVPRYAILAVLPMAPVVALAFEEMGRVLRLVALGGFLLIIELYADKEIRFQTDFNARTMAYRQELPRAAVSGVPIVFESYFVMYAVDGPRRQQSITRFLVIPDSTIRALFPDTTAGSPGWRVHLFRNQALLHNRVFGFPIPLTQAQLDTTPRFYLFALDQDLPIGYRDAVAYGRALFPHHRVTRLNRVVTAFERSPAR